MPQIQRDLVRLAREIHRTRTELTIVEDRLCGLNNALDSRRTKQPRLTASDGHFFTPADVAKLEETERSKGQAAERKTRMQCMQPERREELEGVGQAGPGQAGPKRVKFGPADMDVSERNYAPYKALCSYVSSISNTTEVEL